MVKKIEAKVQVSTEANNWSNLIGYSSAFSDLSQLVTSERLSPVILFSGRAGLGKSVFLRGVAALFFCRSNSACGECASCKRIVHDEHPDVLYVKGENQRLKIKDAALVQEHVGIRTNARSQARHARRVVCLPDVDQLTPQACNRLLKTWEEPPDDAIILMSCSRKNALLATLLSRCFVWPIFPPNIEELLEYLERTIFLGMKKQERPEHRELLELIRKMGFAPGKVLNYFAQQTHATFKEVERFKSQLFSKKTTAERLFLAEEISRKWAWSLEDLLRETEYSLNREYRRVFQSGKDCSESMQVLSERRAFLSQMNNFVLKQKVALNAQLAGERLSLCSIE